MRIYVDLPNGYDWHKNKILSNLTFNWKKIIKLLTLINKLEYLLSN